MNDIVNDYIRIEDMDNDEVVDNKEILDNKPHSYLVN